MTFFDKLESSIQTNNSLLCVGLDPDPDKLPASLDASSDQVLVAFNKAIIDATADLVCAYKPNSAFYEALGANGIQQLQQTIGYINETYPTVPVILDSKRADIGNTNAGYVKHSFEYLAADAITLHPYLGQEALQPFLDCADKGIIILCRTSNAGAAEFQDILADNKPLYQHVAKNVSQHWNTHKNCLVVVGATYPEEMQAVRQIVGPDMYILVPGIGAQGGDLAKTMQSAGSNVIINSARGIIYASSGNDFAQAARQAAELLRNGINKYR